MAKPRFTGTAVPAWPRNSHLPPRDAHVTRRLDPADPRSRRPEVPGEESRAALAERTRRGAGARIGARPTPSAIASVAGSGQAELARSCHCRRGDCRHARIGCPRHVGERISPAVFSPASTAGVFHQATYRRGAVSSARFTADGQSFVYSASWENGPWRAYLGRSLSPDVRDLGVDDARILSISRAGDMAVLIGAQNIVHVFGTPTLARVPLAGGAHRPMETGIIDADWIPGTEIAVVHGTLAVAGSGG